MTKTDIAALLALASALAVAVGDVLQQRATHRIVDTSVGNLELFARLLRNRRWLWGALLLVVSVALQAAALDQGSVLLVQALLVLSLLFALPFSARLARRSVTRREWLWAVLLTAAVTVIVTVGNPRAGHANASLRTWAVVVAVLVPLLAGCVVIARMRGGAVAAVLLAFVSGALWGCSRCSPRAPSTGSARVDGPWLRRPSCTPGCWSGWAVSRGSSRRSGPAP